MILDLGPKILLAFRNRSQRRLRKLNDAILKAAALDCNKINFNLAILSYVLSKIVSKPRFLRRDYSSSLESIEKILETLINAARKGNEEEVLEIFSTMEKSFITLDKKDPRFLISLVSKGKLKMAATFYAQGMSLGVASEMTGLEKQEILDYAGQTMMFDRVKEEVPISERMKRARRFITG